MPMKTYDVSFSFDFNPDWLNFNINLEQAFLCSVVYANCMFMFCIIKLVVCANDFNISASQIRRTIWLSFIWPFFLIALGLKALLWLFCLRTKPC